MGPLSGVKVLEFEAIGPGPFCGMMLADHGAEVIRIESPPGLDPNEGTLGGRDTFDMLNLHRNKRGLTLNLKEPEAKEILYKLVAQSDVVVENYRPDVKFRLGIEGHKKSLVVQATAMHGKLQSVTTGLPIYIIGFQLFEPSDTVKREPCPSWLSTDTSRLLTNARVLAAS
mgnify:CR=1 FL=1